MNIPKDAALYVFWAKFASHHQQLQLANVVTDKERIIVHHGGIGQMVDVIRQRLRD